MSAGDGGRGTGSWSLVPRPPSLVPSLSPVPLPSYLPPMTLKIYTKTGDTGDTGLFGGGRVAKDDPRVEAYGDVDELNAAIGLARAIELMPRIDEVLVPIQRDLFALGALLATPDREKMRTARARHRRRRGGARAAEGVHPPRGHAEGRGAARRAHGLPARRAAGRRPRARCRAPGARRHLSEPALGPPLRPRPGGESARGGRGSDVVVR
jgi:cob(I)alamin adenosyltransferase